MKKLIGLVIVAGFLAAPVAMADEGSGCGLGKQIWVGQSGAVAHILASFTNNAISPSSSSITSGTSGCDANGVIFRSKEQEAFVASNLDRLSQEMAAGQGASLESLASLMGCSTPQYTEFGRLTQDKYGVLFSRADVGTQELLSGLKQEMAAHPSLSACTRIS